MLAYGTNKDSDENRLENSRKYAEIWNQTITLIFRGLLIKLLAGNHSGASQLMNYCGCEILEEKK